MGAVTALPRGLKGFSGSFGPLRALGLAADVGVALGSLSSLFLGVAGSSLTAGGGLLAAAF